MNFNSKFPFATQQDVYNIFTSITEDKGQENNYAGSLCTRKYASYPA